MPFQDPTKLPTNDETGTSFGFTTIARVDLDATLTLILYTQQDILETLESINLSLERLAANDLKQGLLKQYGSLRDVTSIDKSTKARAK